MLVRDEDERDRRAVRTLNVSAFEASAEADLVDALREQARPVVSLVAEDTDRVVGHIMFSPVSLSGDLDRCKELGCRAVDRETKARVVFRMSQHDVG
jgi:predicted N-acetyltransferase YhbS